LQRLALEAPAVLRTLERMVDGAIADLTETGLQQKGGA
jgi:hypothetical protein